MKKIVQNENSYDYKQCKVWEARSQKFAIEGVWGQSPQPPEAIGGVGAEPPALENFAFLKIT